MDDLRAILIYLRYRQTINKSEKLARIVRLTEKKIKELEQVPNLVISHTNKMPLGGGGKFGKYFRKCFGKECSSEPSSPGAAAGPSPPTNVKRSNSSSSSGNLGGLGAVSGKPSSPHASADSSPHASADSAKGKKSSRKSSSHGLTAYKNVLKEARDAAAQLGLKDVVNQADLFITEAELNDSLKGALPDADVLTEEDLKILQDLQDILNKESESESAKSVNVGGGRRRSRRGRSMRKRHTKRPTRKMRVTMRRVRRTRNRRGGQACARI